MSAFGRGGPSKKQLTAARPAADRIDETDSEVEVQRQDATSNEELDKERYEELLQRFQRASEVKQSRLRTFEAAKAREKFLQTECEVLIDKIEPHVASQPGLRHYLELMQQTPGGGNVTSGSQLPKPVTPPPPRVHQPLAQGPLPPTQVNTTKVDQSQGSLTGQTPQTHDYHQRQHTHHYHHWPAQAASASGGPAPAPSAAGSGAAGVPYPHQHHSPHYYHHQQQHHHHHYHQHHAQLEAASVSGAPAPAHHVTGPGAVVHHTHPHTYPPLVIQIEGAISPVPDPSSGQDAQARPIPPPQWSSRRASRLIRERVEGGSTVASTTPQQPEQITSTSTSPASSSHMPSEKF